MTSCSRSISLSIRNLFTESKIRCYYYRDVLENQKVNLMQKILSGSDVDLFEANYLLNQLVKSGYLKDARHIFDKMPHRDEASWTALISGYVNGSQSSEALDLFSQMWVEGYRMDSFVLSQTLRACGSIPDLERGQTIHGHCVKTGLGNSVFVGSALVDFYNKTSLISRACQVFDEMPLRNVVSWTAIMTGLVKAGYNNKVFVYFSEMLKSGIEFDSFTLATLLKACADSECLKFGREIHAQTIKLGFDSRSFVANTLVTMYNKCGKLDSGLHLFERTPNRDTISWTCMITGYVHMGCEENALDLFIQMRKSGIKPSIFTFAAVVSACAGLASIKLGEQFHAHVLRCGLMGSQSVSNAVVTMYSKCGYLSSATMLFEEIPIMRRDVISWTSIIMGHSQEGLGEEAFNILSQMRMTGCEPNEFTLASLLSVCAYMAILEQGKQVHAHILTVGLDSDVTIRSSLINMYSRCGSLHDSSRIFQMMEEWDLVSWTAMIMGYAEHGFSQEAIDLFEEMKNAGLRPDHVAFIGVLTACSHAGLVNLGSYYFKLMAREYQIWPSKEHYGCMIDLLGRAGRLSDAEDLIKNMPFKPDEVVWSMLLRACRVHGDVERGKRTAERILESEPGCAGTYITLSHIYAAKGRWNEAAEMWKVMKFKGVKKEPGWSWIKVKERVSAFMANDRSHPEGDKIYAMLDLLASRTKMAGYVPTLLYDDEY